MKRQLTILGLATAMVVASAGHAQAVVIFFTDRTLWEAAAAASGLAVEDFVPTASNVALADEVGSPPIDNGPLGTTLTFDSANTGLTHSFRLGMDGTSNDQFTFNDTEFTTLPQPFLSIGDVDNGENDDITIEATSAFPLRGFGMDILDNELGVDEIFEVYNTGCPGAGVPCDDGSSVASTPVVGTGGIDFIGFIADASDGIRALQFDESTDGDDIAMTNMAFAVPEPGTLLLLGSGILGLAFSGRRRSA